MPPSEPPPLFATGVAALFLSLVVALLSAEGGGSDARWVAVAWLQSVSYAVGLVCLAGHVLWRVLDHVAASARAREGDDALPLEP